MKKKRLLISLVCVLALQCSKASNLVTRGFDSFLVYYPWQNEEVVDWI